LVLIQKAGTQYQTAIQELSILFNDLQSAVSAVKAQNALSGKWFDEFVNTLESSLTEDHYRGLASLILINQGLGQTQLAVETLIKKRDALEDWLR
jgi:hypothetical protein